MPAANIIETQEMVRNSGFSPSLPSGMFPNLPSASHSTKTTKSEARTMKSQPVYSMTQSKRRPWSRGQAVPAEEAPRDEGQGDDAGDAEGPLVQDKRAVAAFRHRAFSPALSEFLEDLLRVLRVV